jgi:hypothetical protein
MNMKKSYQTALMTILVAAALPLSGWAQTAQQTLDRRKQSLSDNYTRESGSHSCSTITYPGPRKACVFWRDIYAEGATCVRNSLTEQDVTACVAKLRADLKAMESQPESWYDPINAKWRGDARAAAQDYEDTYTRYSRAGTLSQSDLTKFDFRTPRLWRYRLRLQTDIRVARDFLTNDEAAGIVDDFRRTKAELLAVVAPAPAPAPAPAANTAVAPAQTAAARVSWVAAQSGIPAGATPSGGSAQNEQIYICRARMQDGVLHAGAAWRGTCYVGFGGKSVNSKVAEVLAISGGQVGWEVPAGGRIPANAPVAGLAGSTPFHFCRMRMQNGQIQPGKLWKGYCYAPFGQNEIKSATYEVMVVQ